ncbi:MAG: tetratricopeptide repeat protein [Fimbriimonadaceae bacterium]|nr:MAG: tetratricopeptide repeat protein [Fimbriimonadaceae bacterium]
MSTDNLPKKEMSFVGKWFGFGKDPNFDDGIRAYEKAEFAEALAHFNACVTNSREAAVRERAKNYISGCLGKLARRAYDRREFEEALTYLDQATEVRPGFADLWLTKAKVEKALGDAKAAMEHAEKSLEINPTFGGAMVMRGVLVYKLGDYQKGFEEIRRGIETDPRLETNDWKKGLSFHESGNFKQALSEFEQIHPQGGDVNDLVAQGDDLARKGSWKQAQEMFRAATEMAPNYADIRSRHGQSLMELGELAAAAQAFQRAIAINPDYSDAFALLGIVLRRQDDEENAMAAFRQALELDPHHPIASQEILYRRR